MSSSFLEWLHLVLRGRTIGSEALRLDNGCSSCCNGDRPLLDIWSTNKCNTTSPWQCNSALHTSTRVTAATFSPVGCFDSPHCRITVAAVTVTALNGNPESISVIDCLTIRRQRPEPSSRSMSSAGLRAATALADVCSLQRLGRKHRSSTRDPVAPKRSRQTYHIGSQHAPF